MVDKITLKELYNIIFNNASEDRDKALILYKSILQKIDKDKDHHSLLGPVIVKYLERSNKTTDQLLKLANLIQDHEMDDSFSDEEKEKLLDEINEIKREAGEGIE
jgi:hypothetical protein